MILDIYCDSDSFTEAFENLLDTLFCDWGSNAFNAYICRVTNPLDNWPLFYSPCSPDGVALIDQEGLGVGHEHWRLPFLDLVVRCALLDVVLSPVIVIL